MGCQVSYAVRGGMLRAVVSGRTSGAEAAWVARDIAEQAGEQTVKRVLIDLRRLAGRLGTLGTLSMAAGDPGKVGGYRIAVVDVAENDRYYSLHEAEAKRRGFALRSFSDGLSALNWLLEA